MEAVHVFEMLTKYLNAENYITMGNLFLNGFLLCYEMNLFKN